MTPNFLEVVYDLDNSTMVYEMVQQIHPFVFTQLFLFFLFLYCLLRMNELYNSLEVHRETMTHMVTVIKELNNAVFVKSESEDSDDSDEDYVEVDSKN